MSWLWWVQIGADVLLIGGLLALLSRLKGSNAGADLSAPKEMQKFLEEGQRLSQEFDRLLGEKRELVGTTLATLDNRIAQLKALVEDLETRLKKASQVSKEAGAEKGVAASANDPASGPNQVAGQALDEFRKKVLRLARQGKAPAQIAEATGRPRGEVELVLGLSGRPK